MIRISLMSIAILLASALRAQKAGMEEFMYSSGKINVVVAVILIILGFVIFYLMRMERKVKALEEERKEGR